MADDGMACNGDSPRPGVLLEDPMVPGLLENLERLFTVFRLWETPHPASFLSQHSSSIYALICHSPVTPVLIDSLPYLQIVSNYGSDVQHIDLHHCRLKGIAVTNTPAVPTDDVADLAILLMLAVLRRLCAAERHVRAGLWPAQPFFPLAKKASGLQVGIVGLGRIGMAIAKRAEAFDCTISYYEKGAKPNVAYVYYPNVVDLAVNSDVVILSCSLCTDTKHFVSREAIDALGPEGTLINVASASLVDEPELVKALVEGRLGAAGLDVFENEPNVSHELWKMDNVVLSAQLGSGTWEARTAMGKLVVDNLSAYFSGKPLFTPVS